jgi:hypothetical protein
MMDEVRKSGNIECYTPSVEHFRQNVILEGKGGELRFGIEFMVAWNVLGCWKIQLIAAIVMSGESSFITENIPSEDTMPN